MMLHLLRRLVPNSIKHYVRRQIDEEMRRYKAPRMVWGYQDSTGEWRPRTRISDTVVLYAPDRISIGNNVFVWHHTILDGTGGLTLEEGCQLGAWVGIFTHSSHIAIRLYGAHYQEVPEDQKKGYSTKPVRIGKYAGVGSGALISPGVKIGKGALVVGGTVVARDVADYEIVGGNPMRVRGDSRHLDKRYLADPQIAAWYEEWQRESGEPS